jgi:hypothetical protein
VSTVFFHLLKAFDLLTKLKYLNRESFVSSKSTYLINYRRKFKMSVFSNPCLNWVLVNVPATWISDWDIHKFLHLQSMRQMCRRKPRAFKYLARREMLLALDKSLVFVVFGILKMVIIASWCYCNWGSYFIYCTGQLRSTMNYQNLTKTKVCGFLGERSNLYSDNQHYRLLTLFTFSRRHIPIV